MKMKLKKLWKLIAEKYKKLIWDYPVVGVFSLTFMLPAFLVWAAYQLILHWAKYLGFLKITWEPILTLFTLATMLGMSIHSVLILAGVVA
tara:strand:+ start:3416 stop:3685 length:270 start_codon:yes stop_codon:yes gene_type:complete